MGGECWLSRVDAECHGRDVLGLTGAVPATYGTILRLSARRAWTMRMLADLATALSTGSQAEDLGSWDIDDVRRRLPASLRSRGALLAAVCSAKMHPELDPAGRFRTHLRHVPRAVMDRYPDLWRLPVRFARRVQRASDVDGPCIVAVGRTVVDAMVAVRHRQRAARTRESATTTVLGLLSMVQRALGRGPAAVLADVDGADGLVDVVARTAAATQRRRTQVSRLPADMVMPVWQRCLRGFQTLVRCGVFEGVGGVPCEFVLNPRLVLRRMAQLEREDPDRYASGETVHFVAERRLGRSDVEALYAAACRRPRDTAVLALLAEAGFRVGAIAGAAVRDVWDADRGEVLPVIGLLEKGSKVRRHTPNQRLRAALTAYVATMPPSAVWLFSHRHHLPTLPATPSLVRSILRRLFRAAGLPYASPHAFRRYIVNEAMRAGNRLEAVARWMGHASPAVTMKNYWTEESTVDLFGPPAAEEVAHPDPLPDVRRASTPNDDDPPQGWWE